MNWDTCIDLLTSQYDSYIERFLTEWENSSYTEKKEHGQLLMASLYCMVRHDDGEAIKRVLQNDALLLPHRPNHPDEYNKKEICQFDLTYHCDGLSPIGLACKLHSLEALPPFIENGVWDGYAYLNPEEPADCFDFAVQTNLYSEELHLLLTDLGEPISVKLLYFLITSGKDKLAEEIAERGKNFSDDNELPDWLREEFEENSELLYQWFEIDDKLDIPQKERDRAMQKVFALLKKNAGGVFSQYNPGSNIVDCDEKIVRIDTDDDTQIRMVTTQGEYTAQISDFQDCCEIFGGYIICEDPISSFIGAHLLGIYLTDLARNTEIVSKINQMQNSYNSCDYHNIQFINFRTSKGILQFAVYNCHNGYYGHDISIKKNNVTLWKDIL